jgi:TonB family protein
LKNNSVQKSKLYGLIGSTLSSTILLLALVFTILSTPSSTENEGFLVSFGDSFDGGGSGYVPVPSRGSSNNVSTGAQTKTTKTTTVSTSVHSASTPSKQTIFTQEDNSIALNQQKEKERATKIQNDITNQRIETEKRKAEQSRKEQVAINNANAVNGLFGNNGSTGGGKGSGSGTGTGKGTGSGSGNGVQGNPAGKGATGVGYDLRLGNRNYLGRPAKPNYSKDVEGKITVNIRVNENGTVTSTSIGSPTTISDSEMRRDAMSAANKTRFTSGKNIETGSITYNYKLE